MDAVIDRNIQRQIRRFNADSGKCGEIPLLRKETAIGESLYKENRRR